jgi:deoxyhypusine synthase
MSDTPKAPASTSKDDDQALADAEFAARHREFTEGKQDQLVALQTLDLDKVGDFDDLLKAMSLTAFGGRRLGEAGDVLEEMVTDPDCSVVLTLSGAMTVAKMGLLITEMIERGWVQAVVSTGALMTHGLVELSGMDHYKADEDLDDKALFAKGYNRVYDTYEMEKNLNDLQKIMISTFERMPKDRRWSSMDLCRQIGQDLDQKGRRGIMVSAYRAGVPIYIPAFTDSELGLDMATWVVANMMRETGKSPEELFSDIRSPYDPFRDLGHYATIVSESPRLGIFTVGGGVPRNWAQQAPPFIDIFNNATGSNVRLNRFRYGVRICPEPVHWGGLSGCTYSEGVSWGKFLPPSKGGRYAEVMADATTVWPLLVKGVSQRLAKKGLKAAHPPVNLPACQASGTSA